MKHLKLAKMFLDELSGRRSYAQAPVAPQAPQAPKQPPQPPKTQGNLSPDEFNSMFAELLAADLLREDAGLDENASDEDMQALLDEMGDMSILDEVLGDSDDAEEADLSFGAMQGLEEQPEDAEEPSAKSKKARAFAGKSIKGQGGYALLASKENPRAKRWQKVGGEEPPPDKLGGQAWLRKEAYKKVAKDSIGGAVGEKLKAGFGALVGFGAQRVFGEVANSAHPQLKAFMPDERTLPLLGKVAGKGAEALNRYQRYRNRMELPTQKDYWVSHRYEDIKSIASTYRVHPDIVANAMANIGGVAYKRALRKTDPKLPKQQRMELAKKASDNWVVKKMHDHLASRRPQGG